jgi:bifunctional enzyme CysN/CysC
MNEIGLVVLASFTAPEASVRMKARDLVGRDRFALVHVSTPLEACRRRDPAGLYRDAAAGSVTNVPGVDFAYERPGADDLDAALDLELPFHELGAPEVAVRTCVERVMKLLADRGVLRS